MSEPTTQAQSEELLITIEDAQRLLSLSRGSLYNLMESGQLPYVKLARARRLRMSDVRGLIEKNLVTRAPASA